MAKFLGVKVRATCDNQMTPYRWRAQVEWGAFSSNSWPCRTRKEARDLVRNIKAYNRSVHGGRVFDTKKETIA